MATYHDACHLGHAQGITAAAAAAVGDDPRPGAARSARDGHLLRLGRHATTSARPRCRTGWPQRKIENILSTGAQIVLASNAGCLLQIQREVRQRKLPLRSCTRWICSTLSYRASRAVIAFLL